MYIYIYLFFFKCLKFFSDFGSISLLKKNVFVKEF